MQTLVLLLFFLLGTTAALRYEEPGKVVVAEANFDWRRVGPYDWTYFLCALICLRLAG